MNNWTPNSKYRHVYVIIRFDHFHDESAPIELKTTVTKVYLSAETAEAEAKRLNEFRSSQGIAYQVQLGRLVEEPDNK